MSDRAQSVLHPRRPLRAWRPMLVVAALLVAGFGLKNSLFASEETRQIPAPAADEAVAGTTNETAIFAGGCFWGVQGVFQHVAGVTNAVSGYTGGNQSTAHYEAVSTGTTGHAESVRISYDPHKVTYGQLMQVYFSVAHDPTELNRQGPDSGPQYRSAIFPVNADQDRLAKAYIAQLDAAHAYRTAIVTKVEPGKTFYPAEAYHQDFLVQNPAYPYIVYNDLPKVAALKGMFPKLYRPEPVLVADNGVSN